MKHFALLNGEGLMTRAVHATPDEFGSEIMAGRFHLDDDPSIDLARICLCSRGADECMHCGRGSKP